MTTVININPNLFNYVEGAFIPFTRDEIIKLETTTKRSAVPFPQLKGDKFCRMFDRHIAAYQH